MSPRTLLLVFAALGLLATACGSSGSPLSEAVSDVAEGYLSTAYPDASDSIVQLETAIDTACNDGGRAALDAAQDQWVAAQQAWKITQAGWFGPTTMDRHDSRIGWEPADPAGIDATIASDVRIDAAYVTDALPTPQQGLAAIEYLLFGSTPLDERRCEYLTAVAEAAADEAAQMSRSWFASWNGGSAFLDRFTGSADPAMTPRDALGDIVAAMSEHLSVLTLQQLGRELGITAPDPVTGAFPEGDAAFGLGSLRSQIEGLASAYGRAPAAIAGAVASRAPDVDSAIRGNLDATIALIDGVITAQGNTSMAMAVDAHRDELEEAYAMLADVRRTIDTDVVALLDLTLGFSDSDGDSG